MCGRYSASSSPEQVAAHFSVTDVAVSDYRPRYNVAPSVKVLSIVEDEESRRLGLLRWGFVPKWAKQIGGKGQPINARIETVVDSRMFAASFARKRCIIPADGFFEWQDRGKSRPKQPYYIADPNSEPLAFGAIWTSWRDPATPENDPTFSMAIITTAARGAMTQIHDRMPLMLPATLWSDWLTADTDDAPHLVEAVTALGPPTLRATAVTSLVNSVRNDGPELITPGSVDD
ncbi:MAG: SOS response-associated peptidase [Nitriliruptoraceae bacterium]